MGIFDIFKKTPQHYSNPAINQVYELLFCDDLDLYKTDHQHPGNSPWSILFSDHATNSDLEKIAADPNIESRIRVLAYNKLRNAGEKIDRKELLGVIVEVGLKGGLDVLASFRDGTARYINQSGKLIVWETKDDISNQLTNVLFDHSATIVAKLGPWNEPRRPSPAKGMARITFLVSDGLYFGEGPMNALFNDPMASPALLSAAELMKYLMEKVS